MIRHALYAIALITATTYGSQLLSNPVDEKNELILSEKKEAPKTFTIRFNSFFKGLGYMGLGLASMIGICRYVARSYEIMNLDYYEPLRSIWPVVPDTNDPEYADYTVDMQDARKKTNEKKIYVGGCFFLCGAILYLNYHLKVPQNTWHYFKNAFN